jgi:hypothetical protein
MRAIEDDAPLEIVIDVVDWRAAVPALDLDEPFDLDDHTHHRLLNGLTTSGSPSNGATRSRLREPAVAVHASVRGTT